MTKPQILIVEDSPTYAVLLRNAISQTLSDAVEVTHVLDMRGAIEVFTRQHVDAVLLDLNLPDSSGLDTIHRLRAVSNGTPIVIVSGCDDDSIRLQALASGASCYLSKNDPRTMSEVGMMLVAALDFRRRHDAEHDRLFSRLDAMNRLIGTFLTDLQPLKGDIHRITAILFSDSDDNDDRKSPALLTVVQMHSRWIRNATRAVWIALGATLTTVIAACVSALFRSPSN